MPLAFFGLRPFFLPGGPSVGRRELKGFSGVLSRVSRSIVLEASQERPFDSLLDGQRAGMQSFGTRDHGVL